MGRRRPYALLRFDVTILAARIMRCPDTPKPSLSTPAILAAALQSVSGPDGWLLHSALHVNIIEESKRFYALLGFETIDRWENTVLDGHGCIARAVP
jgi:hypothetical protein